MTGLDGVHHVSLTVSDLERSIAWYRDVLGFTVVAGRDQGGLSKAMLRDANSTLVLVLVAHNDNAVPGDFSEFRTGLDHVAFAVTDRAALLAWRDRLDTLGVPRSPVTTGSTGELIAFRDPDNIAVELYTR